MNLLHWKFTNRNRVKFNQYKYGKTEVLLQTADTVNCAYGASFNNEIK